MDKYRRAEDYVMMFVESLKNPKNLPYKINMNRCVDRKKSCRKRHGEIIVVRYLKKQDLFDLDYYTMHERGVTASFEQTAVTVKKFILQSVKKRITKIPDIRDRLDRDPYFRDHSVGLRFTEQEFKIIQRRAEKKKMKVYDYLRQKALS